MRRALIVIALLIVAAFAVPIQDEPKKDDAKKVEEIKQQNPAQINKPETHSTPESPAINETLVGVKTGNELHNLTRPVNGTTTSSNMPHNMTIPDKDAVAAPVVPKNETTSTGSNHTSATCGITDLDRLQYKVTETLEKQIELLLSGRPPLNPSPKRASKEATKPSETVKSGVSTPATNGASAMSDSHKSATKETLSKDGEKVVPKMEIHNATSKAPSKREIILLPNGQLLLEEDDDDGSYKPEIVVRERIIRAPCISPKMDDNLRKMINETVAIAFANVKKEMQL